MSRLLPYPLLAASLLGMWLLLNGFSLGHLLLGSVIAVGASLAMKALEPSKPRIRRWSQIPRLLGVVLIDIIVSNAAVIRIIVLGRQEPRRSGFVMIPLELRDPTGLAVLSCIITSTPGTAWLEYRAANGRLLIHVLDMDDEQEVIDLVKKRYESILMEIFQ